MSHPDDCLPGCMMSDGGEACAGYQHARAEIAELSNQIVELRGWLENRRTGHEQALDLLDKAIRRRERAESEIARLTEQRDRAMKALRDIAEGNGVPDSLLVSKDAFREGFAPFLQRIARAALDGTTGARQRERKESELP